MAANGVAQGSLYNTGYGLYQNPYRDRSAEQQPTQGAQTMIPQFNYGYDGTQSSGLGRYTPPTLTNPMNGANQWSGMGGYSYNLPNAFGGYAGGQALGSPYGYANMGQYGFDQNAINANPQAFRDYIAAAQRDAPNSWAAQMGMQGASGGQGQAPMPNFNRMMPAFGNMQRQPLPQIGRGFAGNIPLPPGGGAQIGGRGQLPVPVPQERERGRWRAAAMNLGGGI